MKNQKTNNSFLNKGKFNNPDEIPELSGLTTKDVGRYFEEYAMLQLEKDGYIILENNYISGKYEIDIIAKKDETVAIIEVKARREHRTRNPEDAVTTAKMLKIYYAALSYKSRLRSLKIDTSKIKFRFDTIAITFGGDYEVKKYKHLVDYYKSDFI